MELLGPEAWRHRDELSEVKRRLGVNHDKFDCWMYKFLENKNFDIDETVAKLQRRAEMERSLLDYEMTDQLRDMMRLGITQIIGDDKEGRLTLYVVTKRDFPKAEVREERKKNFDMWFSYATRIRRGEPRCRITMLINQKDASVWANSDMTFQTNIAIRMSKFYPGMFDRAYVCCMGGALGAFAKPIIKAMPKSISEKIFFFSEKQVHRDKVLHQYFDPAIIPVDLGGTNDCDHPANWNKFAENVEEYFANVKAAISRGMSVKEYEQSVVEEEERQIAELERQARDKKREEDRLLYEQSATSLLAASFGGASRKRWKQQRSGATTGGSSVATSLDACRVIDPETVSLVTADSGDDEDFGSALGTPRLGPVGCPTSLSRQLVILDSLHCISQIEEFLRLSIVHQHDLYLEEMSRLHLSARARHGATQKENDAGDQALQLAKRCPAPARSLTRGILMTVSVIMTIFFVGATLFLVLSASAIVVVMFLSIFINSWNMLPLAFGVILVGNQMGLVGSRGFDLVRNTFRGQLIRPLVVLPNHRTALVLQFLGFIIILVAVLAVFITYTSIDTPLNGIRFALGAGMYACAIVIGLYHAGFPFGLCPDVDHEEERSRSGFSLHLFFNIDEDSSALENRSVTSTIIVTLIPALCALLSGISFMLDASLLFIIATLALTLAAAFSVNHFVRGDHTNINGNLLRGTSWLTCVYWIVIAFIIGLAGLPDMLQGEVIGSTIIVFYFIVLSITCYYLTHTKTPYRVAFRWAYASYSALILAGLITSFLVHWAFGLVMVLLLVHGVACFMRPRSTAMIGSLVTVAVIMFVGLTLILYAYQSASLWDDISKTGAKLEYVPAQRLRHPVCGQHWGDATMLDSSLDPNVLLATDLALFNVLSYYRNTSAINAALNVLFPSFKMTSIQMPQNGMVVMHVFESSKPDMKVVSLVPGSDKLTDMQGLSMWAEAIALQPYGLVLPVNWTAQIVASVAGLTQLFPLPYKNMLDDVEGIVNSIINASSPDTTLLLTGHNYGGGVASVIGSKLHIATVSFDGPGSLISKYKFGIKEWDYLQYVTSVNSASSTLSNVDEPGPTLQGWSCPNDIVTCSQVKTAFCLLQSICGTHLNRSYVGCVSDPPPATTPPRRT